MNRDSSLPDRGWHPGRRLAVGFALALLLVMSVETATPAGASTGVTLTGRINGQSLAGSSQSNPVRLYPLRPATIAVTVQNNSSATVHVATVRLGGVVMGLTFFAFDNSVAFAVSPHSTVTNRYSIPLVGLNGQATGLIQGSLSVLNPGQQVVASQGMVVDVRGSLASVYGVFGLAVALLTLLAFVLVLLELARHRLHSNRFRRGLYFVVPGLGVGLVLVFTLSATRVFVPSVSHWVPLIVFSAVILFVVGFLTPDPGIDDDDEDLALALTGATPASVGSTPAGAPGACCDPGSGDASPKTGRRRPRPRPPGRRRPRPRPPGRRRPRARPPGRRRPRAHQLEHRRLRARPTGHPRPRPRPPGRRRPRARLRNPRRRRRGTVSRLLRRWRHRTRPPHRVPPLLLGTRHPPGPAKHPDP